MPLLKHAKKKLRQDKKRTLANKKVKNLYKALVKEARENPTAEAISKAVSAVDKAAKNKLMHENRAARMKSGLSKLTPELVALKKATAAKTLTKKALKRRVSATKSAAKASRKK